MEVRGTLLTAIFNTEKRGESMVQDAGRDLNCGPGH